MYRVAPNSLVCATLLFHSSPHARIRRRSLTHRSESIELYGNGVYPLQTVSPREINTLHNIFVIKVGCTLSQTRTNGDLNKVHTCIYRCVGRVRVRNSNASTRDCTSTNKPQLQGRTKTRVSFVIIFLSSTPNCASMSSPISYSTSDRNQRAKKGSYLGTSRFLYVCLVGIAL